MTKEQKKKCHKIIHAASIAAGGVGAGLAQIPGSDNAVITPIQLAMAVSLGTVFGVKLSDSSAKAALGSASAAIVGRAASHRRELKQEVLVKLLYGTLHFDLSANVFVLTEIGNTFYL